MNEITRETVPDVDVGATSIAYSDLIDVRVPDSPAMLFPDVIDLTSEVFTMPLESTVDDVVDVVDVEVIDDINADVDSGTAVITDVVDVGIVPDEDVDVIDDAHVTTEQGLASVTEAPERDYVKLGINGIKYGMVGTVVTTAAYGVYSVIGGVASFVTSTPTLIGAAAVTVVSGVTAAGARYRRSRGANDDVASTQSRSVSQMAIKPVSASVSSPDATKPKTVIGGAALRFGEMLRSTAVTRQANGARVTPVASNAMTSAEMVAVRRSTRSNATSPVMLVSVSGTAEDAVYRHAGSSVRPVTVGKTVTSSTTRLSAVQYSDIAPAWWDTNVQAKPTKAGRMSEWMHGEPIVIGSQSESKATDVRAASLAYWGDNVIDDDSLLFDSLTRMWIMLMRDPSTEHVIGSWVGKQKFKPCEVFGSSNPLDRGARCAVGHLLQIVDPDGWNPVGRPVHNDLGSVCHKYGNGFIWDVVQRNDSGRYTLPEIADHVRDELAKRV